MLFIITNLAPLSCSEHVFDDVEQPADLRLAHSRENGRLVESVAAEVPHEVDGERATWCCRSGRSRVSIETGLGKSLSKRLRE